MSNNNLDFIRGILSEGILDLEPIVHGLTYEDFIKYKKSGREKILNMPKLAEIKNEYEKKVIGLRNEITKLKKNYEEIENGKQVYLGKNELEQISSMLGMRNPDQDFGGYKKEDFDNAEKAVEVIKAWLQKPCGYAWYDSNNKIRFVDITSSNHPSYANEVNNAQAIGGQNFIYKIGNSSSDKGPVVMKKTIKIKPMELGFNTQEYHVDMAAITNITRSILTNGLNAFLNNGTDPRDNLTMSFEDAKSKYLAYKARRQDFNNFQDKESNPNIKKAYLLLLKRDIERKEALLSNIEDKFNRVYSNGLLNTFEKKIYKLRLGRNMMSGDMDDWKLKIRSVDFGADPEDTKIRMNRLKYNIDLLSRKVEEYSNISFRSERSLSDAKHEIEHIIAQLPDEDKEKGRQIADAFLHNTETGKALGKEGMDAEASYDRFMNNAAQFLERVKNGGLGNEKEVLKEFYKNNVQRNFNNYQKHFPDDSRIVDMSTKMMECQKAYDGLRN